MLSFRILAVILLIIVRAFTIIVLMVALAKPMLSMREKHYYKVALPLNMVTLIVEIVLLLATWSIGQK